MVFLIEYPVNTYPVDTYPVNTYPVDWFIGCAGDQPGRGRFLPRMSKADGQVSENLRGRCVDLRTLHGFKSMDRKLQTDFNQFSIGTIFKWFLNWVSRGLIHRIRRWSTWQRKIFTQDVQSRLTGFRKFEGDLQIVELSMDSNPWIENFKLIEISFLSEPFSNGFWVSILWIPILWIDS